MKCGFCCAIEKTPQGCETGQPKPPPYTSDFPDSNLIAPNPVATKQCYSSRASMFGGINHSVTLKQTFPECIMQMQEERRCTTNYIMKL
ncbi:hypothetical protein B566_EDAN013202 [Ephemera danica]|nr:hypothetical protein B566_EDAN013202 [Ephemera danica]